MKMATSRTLLALAIAATMVIELAMAANYTVADSDGWELGSNFQSWASSKNFTVGDVLIFDYSASHDVLEVNEPDFSSCSASNPIQKHAGGSTAITLLTSGKRFFICGVPGHCLAGMKVQIDTLATSSPPSPPPSSSPAAPTSPPASPPPSSSPAAPTSPPASPPKAATMPPAKSPLAPPPGSNASPPAPPAEPTPPSSAPTPEPPIPPFPFDKPLIPSAAPTTPPPPPPPSSAYKCSFRVHLSVGFSFLVMMLLSL